MRHIPFIAAALVVCVGEYALAQGLGLTWNEYVSKEDFFSVNFPGQPTVEKITYPTEYRITLAGRTYRHDSAGGRFSVTVVDYADTIKLHLERNKKCQAAGGDGDQCQDDGPEDMRGVLVFASWNFMKRDGVKLTHYAHYNSDRVEGHEIHLTNADGILYVRRRPHARKPAVHTGGYGAARGTGAGIVSDIVPIPRQGLQTGSLRVGRHATVLKWIPTAAPNRAGSSGRSGPR